MLVVDECHRAASEENRKSMERRLELLHWAFHATPERQYFGTFGSKNS